MTEEDAIARVGELASVPRETWTAIERFIDFLREEATRQNLISAATMEHIWARHILDSAQLLKWDRGGHWLDLGTGAGFPGLVVGTLRADPTTLVESRRGRIEFLRTSIALVGAGDRMQVFGGRLETMPAARYDVISARAFAPLGRLLALAHPLSTPKTVWILPKGRSAQSEVEEARRTWQGDFRVEQSLTDPDAGIIIATDVEPRRKAGSRA